jgi:hypothetical protein
MSIAVLEARPYPRSWLEFSELERLARRAGVDAHWLRRWLREQIEARTGEPFDVWERIEVSAAYSQASGEDAAAPWGGLTTRLTDHH